MPNSRSKASNSPSTPVNLLEFAVIFAANSVLVVPKSDATFSIAFSKTWSAAVPAAFSAAIAAVKLASRADIS